MSGVKIISASSELGAGTRGAGLGFHAIQVAAWNTGNNFFAGRECIELPQFNFLLNDPGLTYAQRAGAIAETLEIIAESVADTIHEKEFPLVISGDHSNAAGTIAGLAKAWPDKRIGVVWIDAHADLHSPFTTPSGNIHGMPLAMALGIDNKESANNDPGDAVVDAWDLMKQAGGKQGKLTPAHLVFIGVRDTEIPERNYMDAHHITNHTVEDLREKGCAAIVKNTLYQLNDCDLVYVSFDVDSMDSSLSMGTGTPVPKGLSFEEAKDLCRLFAASPQVHAFEITEVNPTLDDKQNKMAEMAFEILATVTREIESRL